MGGSPQRHRVKLSSAYLWRMTCKLVAAVPLELVEFKPMPYVIYICVTLGCQAHTWWRLVDCHCFCTMTNGEVAVNVNVSNLQAISI